MLCVIVGFFDGGVRHRHNEDGQRSREERKVSSTCPVEAPLLEISPRPSPRDLHTPSRSRVVEIGGRRGSHWPTHLPVGPVPGRWATAPDVSRPSNRGQNSDGLTETHQGSPWPFQRLFISREPKNHQDGRKRWAQPSSEVLTSSPTFAIGQSNPCCSPNLTVLGRPASLRVAASMHHLLVLIAEIHNCVSKSLHGATDPTSGPVGTLPTHGFSGLSLESALRGEPTPSRYGPSLSSFIWSQGHITNTGKTNLYKITLTCPRPLPHYRTPSTNGPLKR